MVVNIRGEERWISKVKVVDEVMDNLLPCLNSVSLSSGEKSATFELTKIKGDFNREKSDVYKIRYTFAEEEYQQVELTLSTVSLLYKIVDFLDGKLEESTIVKGMMLSKLCE